MKIASEQNLADPLTKTLPERVFTGHLEGLGLRDMSHLRESGRLLGMVP